jgi:hypothetical protein
MFRNLGFLLLHISKINYFQYYYLVIKLYSLKIMRFFNIQFEKMNKKLFVLIFVLLLANVVSVWAPAKEEMTVDAFRELDDEERIAVYNILYSPKGEFFDLLPDEQKTAARLITVGADEQSEERINGLKDEEKQKFLANNDVNFKEHSAARNVAGEYLNNKNMNDPKDRIILQKYLESGGKEITFSTDSMPADVKFEKGTGNEIGTIKFGDISLDIKEGMGIWFIDKFYVESKSDFVIKHGDNDYTIKPTGGSKFDFGGQFNSEDNNFKLASGSEYSIETQDKRFPKAQVNKDVTSIFVFNNNGELQSVRSIKDGELQSVIDNLITLDVAQGEFEDGKIIIGDNNVGGEFNKNNYHPPTPNLYDLKGGSYLLYSANTRKEEHFIGQQIYSSCKDQNIMFDENNLVSRREYSGPGEVLEQSIYNMEALDNEVIKLDSVIRKFGAGYTGTIYENEESYKSYPANSHSSTIKGKEFIDERHINYGSESYVVYKQLELQSGNLETVSFNFLGGPKVGSKVETTIRKSPDSSISIGRVSDLSTRFTGDLMSTTYYVMSPDGENYHQVTETMRFNDGKMQVVVPSRKPVTISDEKVVASNIYSYYSDDYNNVMAIRADGESLQLRIGVPNNIPENQLIIIKDENEVEISTERNILYKKERSALTEAVIGIKDMCFGPVQAILGLGEYEDKPGSIVWTTKRLGNLIMCKN